VSKPLRRCAFENIDSGTKSVEFQHATPIPESRDLCRMGVCTVRRSSVRTRDLFSVGPSYRGGGPPRARSYPVLESVRPGRIAKHSRGAAMMTLRATHAEAGRPLTSLVARSWFEQAWDVLSDLLIATALIWTLPLLLGATAALAKLLLRAM